VTYVRNITDVDDKINARAAERGIAIRDLTEETYRYFKEDVAALGCLPPTEEPRATEYVRRTDGKLDMVTLIERLARNQNAYIGDDHVLFYVPSMPDYGKLSKRSLDEMIAGARVEVAPYKRSPMDFVLWKPSDLRTSNQPLPQWQSPCDITTPGRPGWHIECSAMSGALLGETFDIHGGGIDLVFPHHENEIAQSRCAFHTPFMARYWMHNGFLQVEGEKMAKSAGNFVTIRELLTDWPGEVIRFNMLRTHYHQPMDWTVKGLEESEKILDSWYDIVGDATIADSVIDDAVIRSLSDDLNTPDVLTRLHALAGEIRRGASGLKQIQLKQHLKASGSLIGLLTKTKRDHIESHPHRFVVDHAKVEALIRARSHARSAKDFAQADQIRQELASMRVEVEDKKDGTTAWKVKR
jgi:cysteinyl-tRNA synthetase